MEISSKEITNFNILNVTIGSTGDKGGDAGAGGKTIFRLEDKASTVWNLKFEDEYHRENIIPNPTFIEIEFQGDTELQTFTEALEFALTKLKSIKKV